MAKLQEGILGPFTGKVGTVVGYLWKGRAVVRAYSRRVRYPNTEGQQAERNWFVRMVRFAAEARPALLLGLRDAAARGQMTEGNLFVKRNKGCFALDGSVDYSRLLFSEGPTAPVRFEGCEVDAGQVLRVRYGRGGGRGGDAVYVYAYCPQSGQGLLSAAARRDDGTLAMLLPDEWRGCRLEVYGFAVDAAGRASRSVWLQADPAEASQSAAGNKKGTEPEAPSLKAVVSAAVTADVCASSVPQSPPSQACGESAWPYGCTPAVRIR
ncbi:MAG: hypothetical protein J6I49_03830 [Bacteroidales bacterium]|nr:hypothetical protein [Bacteroidales bacterium]